MAKKPKTEGEPVSSNPLPLELGRLVKLLALYLLKGAEDEGEKIMTLNAVAFPIKEIARMLGKTENNVRVSMFNARKKKGN